MSFDKNGKKSLKDLFEQYTHEGNEALENMNFDFSDDHNHSKQLNWNSLSKDVLNKYSKFHKNVAN